MTVYKMGRWWCFNVNGIEGIGYPNKRTAENMARRLLRVMR